MIHLKNEWLNGEILREHLIGTNINSTDQKNIHMNKRWAVKRNGPFADTMNTDCGDYVQY